MKTSGRPRSTPPPAPPPVPWWRERRVWLVAAIVALLLVVEVTTGAGRRGFEQGRANLVREQTATVATATTTSPARP